MKKQIKLLGVLAVALTLGLAACNGGGGKDSQGGEDGSSSRHQHTAAENAPWQSDDSKHWKDCVANDGGKVDNKSHTFGDPYDVQKPTCTEAGSQKVKCTVCGREVTQTLKALGHDWVDDETGGTPATCTQPGSKNQHCSRCDATQEGVEIPALGHNYGEWTVVEGKAPTCTEKGQEQRVCDRCGDIETREVDALDHDLELVGGETPAPVGEATVRLYRCKRCGVEFLGFKADEPSAESLPHLMKGENDGMRFFGRPIGNALALDKNGTSVKQENNECVYCSTETGDFFEYIFTLNETQAASLATCRLYCDARPADHLSGDFWAYGRGNTDWTPGYYIDGADNHVQHNEDGTVMMVKDHARSVTAEDGSQAEGVELETEVKMGARIEDYRYILYVDGNPVEFDADTAVPVKGSGTNMTRAEYVLPYTFHLHSGTNRISLRMAGGYRSEFYNFVFRPYVEPTPVQINETNVEIKVGETAQITSSMTELKYASANAQVATVDANGLITGVKAGSTTITVSKEGNYKSFKLPVKVNEKDGVFQVEAETGVSSKDEGGQDQITFRDASGSRRITDAFPKDAVLTVAVNAPAADDYQMTFGCRRSYSEGASDMAFTSAFEIKVNDVAVTSEKAVSGTSWADYVIGNVALNAGANTLTLKALTEVNPINLDYFKFEPASELPPAPVDPWIEDTTTVMPTPAADGAIVKRYIQEGTDDVKYEIDVKTANMALDSGSWKNDPATSGKMKLNGDGDSAHFSFALPKGFEGKMYQFAYMDGLGAPGSTSGNGTKKAFYEKGVANIEVKINGGDALDLSSYETTTFNELFGDERAENNSDSVNKNIELGDVVLSTNNTISYKRVKTLNMIVSKFVFIGKDHVHTNWTDGAKVEKTATTSAYQNGECSCGAKRVLIDVASDLNGKITKRGAKLGAKGDVAKYVFSVPAEAVGKTAQLYFKATVDNAGNYNYNYYTGKNGGSSAVTLPDNKTNTEVKFNSNVVVLPTTSYKDLGMTGLNEAGAGTFLVNTVTLAASNELTLERLDSFGVQYYEIFVVYE